MSLNSVLKENQDRSTKKKKKFIHVCTLRKGEGKKKGLLVDNSKYLSWVFVGIYWNNSLRRKEINCLTFDLVHVFMVNFVQKWWKSIQEKENWNPPLQFLCKAARAPRLCRHSEPSLSWFPIFGCLEKVSGKHNPWFLRQKQPGLSFTRN